MIDTPPLNAVAQGLAQLWAIEAKGFSPDGNLLLVKVTYSDSAFTAVTTRTAFWIYDLSQAKYTACVNTLIASDRPLEVSDVVISQSGGKTQLVASYHATGVSEALDPNKLALISDSVLIQADLVASLSGNQADASITALRSTADGRFVVLETAATNLVRELDTNGSKDIFVLDQLLHTVRRITTVSGAEPVVDSLLGDARIGADGSLSVAFQSSQAFTTQDSNAADDVFVWRLASSQFASADSGAITLVSRMAAGAVGGSNPLLNANGVLFDSESSAFNSNDVNGANDVWQSTGSAVSAVSSSGSGTFTQGSGLAGSSSNGLHVALVSSTPDVAGGVNQLLVINPVTHAWVVVSKAADGSFADDVVISPVLSANGSAVAFSSQASNLSGTAPDGLMHLFVLVFNQAPSITSAATASVAENTAISTVIYTATATDPDASDTKTWSLTGTDASLLNIDSGSGQVTLKAAANYEAKASYSFSVVDTDSGGLTGSQAVSLAVTDVYEDLTGPGITSVVITGAVGAQSNTSNQSDVVSAKVTLDEVTLVTGTPQLAINIGGKIGQAQYVSGSGSTELLFGYTILAGQSDTDGISIGANSLQLNGATLVDASGNSATLTHGVVGANASYLVDTAAPTLALTSSSSSMASGDTATITFTFSETPVGFAASDVTVTGGALTSLAANANNDKIYTATFTAAVSESFSISTAAGAFADAAGNLGAAAATPLISPTASAGKAVDLLAYSWSAHTLLSAVGLLADGHAGTTDASGAASLAALTSTSLVLTASRAIPATEASATDQAVNLQDAIAILKMIVGLDVNGAGKALSPYQAYAADYDGNGKVELSDAIGVLKHVVGLDAPAPQWLFFNEIDATVPGKANLLPGSVPALSIDLSGASPVHAGLVGVLRGDVDGSYSGIAGDLDLDTDATHKDYFTLLLAAHKELSPSQFGVYP